MKLIRKIARLETPRLILRQWRDEDRAHYARMTADPEVMRYFPQTLSENESNEKVESMRKKIAQKGWGFWAVERKQDQLLIGLTGLNIPDNLPLIDNIEIGWQFAVEAWGKGYATEAASTALDFAFNSLDLTEVVAFTAEINNKSRALMQRLGMANSNKDFPHPSVPDDNPLKPHVLYQISKKDWLNKAV